MTLKRFQCLFALSVAVQYFVGSASAQYLLPYAVRLDVSKYFGQTNAFSAVAELTDGERKAGVTNQPNLVFKFAFLNGMTRSEVDMSQWQGDLILDEAMRIDMRRYNTEQAITIVNPHKAVFFVIYPKLKSYVRTTFEAEIAKELKNIPNPKSLTELSRETIYGHPCVKYRVTFAEEGEDERKDTWGLNETSGGQALLWKATDLGGLPIKYEGRNGGGYETLAFKELKPAKPDTKLFDPPTSYTRFDSLELLYKAKVKSQGDK